MTTKFKILFVIAFSFCLLSTNIFAQKTSTDSISEKKAKPFQISFCYPVGTNGIQSYEHANEVSLNILAGYNGGVEKFEAAGFANINKGNVKGFQGAGFLNVNTGSLDGFQGAGHVNVNLKDSKGFMGSGFTNVVKGDMIGIQGTGFANVTIGKTVGFQGAGFLNFSKDSIRGAQMSGFTNVAKDVKGFQGTGFANVAKNVKGAQIAGFVNVAKNVKGTQIGFINVADSVDGIPIGFLSFVRNGYHKVEVGASESLFANVSLKLGVQKFYNILTVGFKQFEDDTYWSYGYGVGTQFRITDRINANLDLTAQQINENKWHTNKVNILNTIKLNASYKLSDKLEVVAGPSFNVMVSEFDFREGIGTRSSFVPWAYYDQTHDKYSVKMFVGFNAAVRF